MSLQRRPTNAETQNTNEGTAVSRSELNPCIRRIFEDLNAQYPEGTADLQAYATAADLHICDGVMA